MIIITVILGIYAGVGTAYWLWMAYGAVRLWREVPKLDEAKPMAPGSRPRVSVVVPACNEADKVEAAFRTLMQQDYPELELILVDDRSTDETGLIADRLGAEDVRVRVIHISELPQGWLGKLHAMDRGYAASTGEYVLFTDADVHFGPGAIEKAAAYAVENKLDHLTVIPHLWSAGILTDAIVCSFLRPFMVMLARPWKVSDAKSRAFMGVGAFNMVRREAFARTEGLAWLRMEVGDDMALGFMMKRSGARCGVAKGLDEVGLVWHRTVREALRGSEKGYAPVCQFSVWRGAVAGTALAAVEMSPMILLMGIFSTQWRVFGLMGIVLTMVALAAMVMMARWAKGSVLAAVVSPVGTIIGAWAMLRAGVLGRRRGGIVWRGTRYTSEELRKGMRLNLRLSGKIEDKTTGKNGDGRGKA